MFSPREGEGAASFLNLSGLERFSLREVRLDPSRAGLFLRVEGIARQASTSAGGFQHDHRLTMLEVLRSSIAMLILVAVAWMIPTTIAVYRLYRELRR
jgi:hypothetical protein